MTYIATYATQIDRVALPIALNINSALWISLHIGQPSPIHSWFVFAMIVICAISEAMMKINRNNIVKRRAHARRSAGLRFKIFNV